ncbi:MAG: pilus assembly protein N-terminal domain-containing protein [Terracidiphilus sp.]|jgi:pilus assembly protein CpaC
MRAKTYITVAFFSALSFVLCGASDLRAQSASASIDDSANDLYVAVGKTVLVDTAKPIKRVSIGLGDVAEAHVVNGTEIMVNGKAAGETSLIIWDRSGGRQFFNVTVRAGSFATNDSLEAVRRELRAELPGQNLKVTYDNGVIFLRGTVKDLTSSARAVRIASTAGKVSNLLDVEVPPSDPQILLKVRFCSVDRSKETQLGINIFSTGFGNTLGQVSTGEFSPPGINLPLAAGAAATATIGNDLNILAFYPGLNLGATIQALENKGIVEVLAQPNVLATNGKQASFLAGGEYPYPIVQGTASGGAGAVTLEFQEYGVRLDFLPTLTPRGTIRLQVAPEVSSLDFTNGIELAGFDVPGIDTRKMKTEVELKDGQSFVIGGLLDNRDTETFEKIPFLGDIPILGKFFQSSQKTKTNTELVVIVTLELVAPMEAGDPLPQLKYPGKFLPPNTGAPMNTPDAKTAANTLAPKPAAIPVESLINSMKPETPLVVQGASGTFGSATAASPQSTTPSTTAGEAPQ